jgi:hypothetical protein
MMVLRNRGVLNRLGETAEHLLGRLSSMAFLDQCQDITLGNAVPTIGNFLGHVPILGLPLRRVGICGAEVPGGQVTHFMRDQGQDKHVAYKLSFEQIWNTSCRAWALFKAAFPPPEQPPHHGVLGFFEKVYDYSPVGLAVHGIKDAVHEGEKLDAEWHLGRALHTLQDSFSPAHTQRLFTEPWTILDIYEYSTTNRDPQPVFPGHPTMHWPGHTALDHPGTNPVSQRLRAEAERASTELVSAVLGNLFDSQGAVVSDLKSVLARNLAWHF